MFRKTLIILAMLFAILGPGAEAWGQTKESYTATITSKIWSSNGTQTLNNVDWTLTNDGDYYGYDGTKGQQVGSGSKPAKNMSLSTNGISGTISSVKINTSGANSVNANVSVSVGGTQWGNAKTITATASDYTFTGTGSGEIVFTWAQTSSKALYFKSITVVYQSTPSATLQSIEVSGEAADLWTADEFSHEGITVMANWSEGNPTNVTSACEYSGYDMTSAGEQTVTVSYTAGEVTKSDTYTVTVNTIGNTQDEPYTVAQAKALIDAGNGLNEEVYVEGIICQVDSYNSTYHSITYWISADGTTTDKFEVYSGLNAEDQDPFSSKDDLTVGYSAIIKGKITKYEDIYEFSKNSRLVSYTPPTQKLPTPTNLAASELSMTGATLSWNAVEHASSYTVNVTGANEYDKTYTNITENSKDLDGLTAGTKYSWTVKAIGNGGTYLDSDESETADFTTPTTALYNVTIVPADGGTIKAQIGGEDITQAANGATVSLVANSNTHFTFTSWNVYGTEEPYTAITVTDNAFTMPDYNVTVTATFTEEAKYKVTYAKGGDDVTGEIPTVASYYAGEPVEVAENPFSYVGHTFDGWSFNPSVEIVTIDDVDYFEMPASNVTVTATWAEKTQYTVSYVSLGTQIGTEQVYEGDLCANVPTVSDIPTGWTFLGWTTGSADNTTTAPEPFDLTTPIISATTLNAVFTKTEGEASWDETALADLTSSDVFVMVGTNNKLLQNNNKTAVSATIEDGQVTTAIIDNYKWNVTEKDGSYVFNANGSTNVLYFINDNNGVKFGTPQSSLESTKYFTQNNSGYIVGTDGTNTRYLSYYSNNNDWRCYKNLNNNPIAMKFYKLNAGTTYYTTVAPASEYAIAIDENIEHGTVEVEGEITAAIAGTEITLIVTPEEHYSLAANSLTVTGASSAIVKVNSVPGTVGEYTFMMPAEAVTVTAQFTEEQKLTVYYHANDAVTSEQVYAGDIQLTAPDNVPNGYSYVGWATAPIEVVVQSATYFSSYNVTENVDLYAVFAIAEGGGATALNKMGAGDVLNNGDNIVIVATGDNWAKALYQETVSTSYVNFYDFTGDVNDVIANSKKYVTLNTATEGKWKLGDETNGYVYNASSNNLTVDTKNSTEWTISWVNDKNKYSIKNVDRWLSCRNDLTGDNQYKFRGGGTTTTNGTVYFDLYKLTTSTTTYSNFCTTVNALSGTITQSDITANTAYYISDVTTINSAVEIAALTNDIPANLIIKDGAQLVFNNSGVKATVEKNIIPYNSKDGKGWHFLAAPMEDFTVASFIEQAGEGEGHDYDLYRWYIKKEDGTPIWYNYKRHHEEAYNEEAGTGFETYFVSGRGYLAAYETNDICEMKGTLNAGTTFSFTVNSKGNFTLLGNPFTYELKWSDFNKTGVYDKGFAVVDSETGIIKYVTDTPIKVGTGFMVYTEEIGAELSFTKSNKSGKSNDIIALNLFANNGNGEDNTIIVLDDENGGFAKADNFNTNAPQIYTERLQTKYGIRNFNTSTKEFNVSFKAVGEGSNTIRLETIGEFDYVHLYDKLLDIDVDMLLEGSYTFEASEDDDTHRFIVRIDKGNTGIDENETENFVNVYNGEIHVSGSGEVQIFDVMGRMVHSEVISGDATISTGGFKGGVYVVRLIGGGWTKTEKIVVRR